MAVRSLLVGESDVEADRPSSRLGCAPIGSLHDEPAGEKHDGDRKGGASRLQRGMPAAAPALGKHRGAACGADLGADALNALPSRRPMPQRPGK